MHRVLNLGPSRRPATPDLPDPWFTGGGSTDLNRRTSEHSVNTPARHGFTLSPSRGRRFHRGPNLGITTRIHYWAGQLELQQITRESPGVIRRVLARSNSHQISNKYVRCLQDHDSIEHLLSTTMYLLKSLLVAVSAIATCEALPSLQARGISLPFTSLFPGTNPP